jgi:hypothetical protein
MICYIPGTDDVFLCHWPSHGGLEDYEKKTGKHYWTIGACCAGVEKMSFGQRKMAIFVNAMHLVIRDECDPVAFHKALLGLDEYNDGLAYDVPGRVFVSG